jgi:hypothetical protein
MSDRTLRYLIATAFGLAWGVVSSAVVAAVSLLSARLARAGGSSSVWFLLPTLLFTVVPTVIVLARAHRRDEHLGAHRRAGALPRRFRRAADPAAERLLRIAQADPQRLNK